MAHKNLDRSVARLAERIQSCRRTRDGQIVIETSGDSPARYVLACGAGGVDVRTDAAPTATPTLVIIADADILRSVLDGERDAREQFFEGGLRVRGDLRYLSDLALELGILKSAL